MQQRGKTKKKNDHTGKTYQQIRFSKVNPQGAFLGLREKERSDAGGGDAWLTRLSAEQRLIAKNDVQSKNAQRESRKTVWLRKIGVQTGGEIKNEISLTSIQKTNPQTPA